MTLYGLLTVSFVNEFDPLLLIRDLSHYVVIGLSYLWLYSVWVPCVIINTLNIDKCSSDEGDHQNKFSIFTHCNEGKSIRAEINKTLAITASFFELRSTVLGKGS